MCRIRQLRLQRCPRHTAIGPVHWANKMPLDSMTPPGQSPPALPNRRIQLRGSPEAALSVPVSVSFSFYLCLRFSLSLCLTPPGVLFRVRVCFPHWPWWIFLCISF